MSDPRALTSQQHLREQVEATYRAEYKKGEDTTLRDLGEMPFLKVGRVRGGDELANLTGTGTNLAYCRSKSSHVPKQVKISRLLVPTSETIG
jgi:hypothetical protein